MKKIFTSFLVLAVLFTFVEESMAMALKRTSSAVTQDDLGVQAVGGGAEPKSVEPMRFDNVTFGKAYKIDGYATITLLGFKFVDMFAQWEEGKAGTAHRVIGYLDRDEALDAVFYQKPKELRVITGKDNNSYENCNFKESGNESEFAWLKVDIQNLQKTAVGFMKNINIKVIYDDEYEYNGWVRQFNYDYSKSEIYRYKGTTPIGWPVCLSPIDEMSISPMYKGHYAFGCTLPNFIVEDKNSPLRMVIKLDEHELTYNIR